MNHKLYTPARVVQPMKKKELIPEKSGRDFIHKGKLQNNGIDPSELFSHFTANIINEKKVFTR